MKHTLTKGFELNNEELLFSSKIEEIISLRDFKVTNFDLSLFDVYYFDSNNGDDLNDGKSLSSAKNSLLELHNLFKLEKPLLIYINNGSYYKGNISIDRNYPTIISSINNKNAPIIEGDDSVIRIYSSNVKIYGLEICGKNALRGIHITPNKKGVMENIIIESNYVHDINFNWYLSKDSRLMNPDTFDIEKVTPEYEDDGVTKGRYFYRYHGGIIAHNEVGPSSFKNIYFINNIVKNVSRTGITLYNKWVDKPGVGYGYNKWMGYDFINNYETGEGYFVSNNVYCVGNYVECAGGDAIVMSSIVNCLVRHNICYYANYLGRQNYWNAGIWVYNVDCCLFEENEAGYTLKRRGSEDGQGFDIDNACVNTIMQHNYAHHNEGGGLLICNLATPVNNEKITGHWFNNVIYNNYFELNGTYLNCTRSAFITIAREVDHVVIKDNVVEVGDIRRQSIIHTEDQNTYCFNHTYVNNVFFSNKESDALFSVHMLKDSKFIDNSFINIAPFGTNKEIEYTPYSRDISFMEIEDIYQRREIALSNLKDFVRKTNKGDYTL